MGYPATNANLTAIVAWESKEDGGWGHAAYNPLNTTRLAKGSTSYNSVGVRNYLSCEQGLEKTVETLRLKSYGGIRASLASGGGDITRNVELNTWGTHLITASYLKQVQATVAREAS